MAPARTRDLVRMTGQAWALPGNHENSVFVAQRAHARPAELGKNKEQQFSWYPLNQANDPSHQVERP